METIKEIEVKHAELLEKYLNDGPFVYELYAVMVHQGGAFGGHYYAYIKDF
jgi:ubiquitin carboxyl-terminal hydrolase 47